MLRHCVILLLCCLPALSKSVSPQILVFTKTAGYRHESIPVAIAALRSMGSERGWQVDATENATEFTDSNLRRYDVVVWLNTSGDVLDPAQQAAYERFHQSGKGTVAIHEGGTDTEREGWPWYRKLASVLFVGHPPIQEANLTVLDRTHPAAVSLPLKWRHTDEFYNFDAVPTDAHILLSIDESSYDPGPNAMQERAKIHPMAWCKEFDGGRYFYTALGHTTQDYSDKLFLAHVGGAIDWALGKQSAKAAALCNVGVAIGKTADTSPTTLEPAPVSLPETYVPPARGEVESILGSALTAKPDASARPLRVVLCASAKDEGHSVAGMHDYPLWRERWSRLLALADGVTVEPADVWPTVEQWRRADVVVVNSYNPAWALESAGSARINALGRDINTFLARGGGLVFIHYALNAGLNAEALATHLGLAWRGAPPYSRFRHDASEWQLDKTHPLAVGLREFKVPDESYWSLAGNLDAAGAHVLLSSMEEGAPRPQMWTREMGKGRVFVSIPGHSTWTYDDPIYRILIFRGMMWSAREPIDRLASLVPIGARFDTHPPVSSSAQPPGQAQTEQNR